LNFLAKHSAQLNGEVICPGDKSISQRIVMIASYLNADINITGFLMAMTTLTAMHLIK
jgi:5-enolpyruvylshikimate-3-phosphate synthase